MREPRRIGVILGQALDMILQSIDPRRRQHAGLAHAAADHLAPTLRLFDEICVPNQQRADWGTEAFDKHSDTQSKGLAISAADLPMRPTH